MNRAEQPALLKRLMRFSAISLACATAVAQHNPIDPVGDPQVSERIDSERRISGSLPIGFIFHGEGDAIGASKLWAYVSTAEDASQELDLTLRINSVDGRYQAELSYTVVAAAGWIPLRLPLNQLEFLSRYDNPLRDVAVLLSGRTGGADGGVSYFPVRWGPDHEHGDPPADPVGTDRARIFINADARADAFIATGGGPAACEGAVAESTFMFNRICDIALSDIRVQPALDGRPDVRRVDVHQRVRRSFLEPIRMEVQFAE